MNRNYRRKAAVSMLLAVTMTAGTAAAAYADSAVLSKNETVYVVTKDNGAVKDTIVSDKITGSGDVKTVTDTSSLKDIEVVKGNAKMNKSGNSITWTTNGDEVCYQGKTDKSTPVTMEVSYYIDGKEMSGKELQGKSGNVKIVIKYTNKSVPCVPFIAVSGFVVDKDCLSNITVDHGKVIEDGEKTMVAGLAAPGIGTAVGQKAAEKIGLNDTVTIEGKADKFSVDEIMTAVTSEFSSEFDTDKLDVSIDMGDGMKQLKNGAKKVATGSKKLENGTNTLKSGINQLSSKLSSSMTQLGEGAGKLNAAIGTSDKEGLRKGVADLSTGVNGTKQLADGTKQCADGTKQYADGTYQAIEGSKQILAKMKEANPEADYSALEQALAQAEGAAQQTAGYAQKTSELAAQTSGVAGQVAEGVASLQNGVAQISAGMNQLCTSIGGASSNTELSEGLSKLNNGAATLAKGQKQLSSGANKLAAGLDKADKTLNEMVDELTGEIDKVRGSLNAGRDYNNFSGISGNMDGSVRFIYKTSLK